LARLVAIYKKGVRMHRIVGQVLKKGIAYKWLCPTCDRIIADQLICTVCQGARCFEDCTCDKPCSYLVSGGA